jgi:uncharacterized protein YceK
MTIDTQRNPGYHGPQVYSGSRFDLEMLWPSARAFSFGGLLFALGDLPFSFVADTVLLPVTIPRDSARAQERAAELQVETERPSPVTPLEGEAPLDTAKRLFAQCQLYVHDRDDHLSDCYSIDAKIALSDGSELRGADYKVRLRAGLAHDRESTDFVEWRKPEFELDGGRVRVTATRASTNAPHFSPITLLLGPAADGGWRILEEAGVGWAAK